VVGRGFIPGFNANQNSDRGFSPGNLLSSKCVILSAGREATAAEGPAVAFAFVFSQLIKNPRAN
jgi:hypothetical protein